MMLNNVYLLLGSNLNDPLNQLLLAKENIQQKIGSIAASSSVYRTAAWGKTDQPDFFNRVILLQTKYDAAETLKQILAIEEKMGRIRAKKNDPRLIDIDILFFNEAIITSKDLVVPHPEICRRRFVLTPLVEMAPFFIHPVLKKTMKELLHSCSDALNVQKI